MTINYAAFEPLRPFRTFRKRRKLENSNWKEAFRNSAIFPFAAFFILMQTQEFGAKKHGFSGFSFLFKACSSHLTFAVTRLTN